MPRWLLVSAALLWVATAPSAAAQGEDLPPCPTGLAAENLGDGVVRLTWDAVAGADGYNGFRNHDPRSTNPEEFLFIGHVTDTTLTDGTTHAGVVYGYFVTATQGSLQSEGCPPIQVTGVPVFPSPLAGVLAAASVGLLALVVHRRRT